MIVMKDVSVEYDRHIQALKHMTLTFEHKCYAIIGQNGSGKSTLLQSLVGLIPIQGQIQINDLFLEKKNFKEIREQVGLVFQNPDHQLFMSNTYDDLAFGLINLGLSNEEIQLRIETISQKMSLSHLLQRSSHQLSGGQKRMIAIASVLIMEPEIVLMDEPSSFLDPKSRRQVIQWIQSMDKTVIVATHDLDMALDIADEVILLNEGQVIVKGKAQEILTNQELLENNGLELPYCYQR